MEYCTKFNHKIVDIATEDNNRVPWCYVYFLIDTTKFETIDKQDISLDDKSLPNELREIIKKDWLQFYSSNYHSTKDYISLYKLLNYYISNSKLAGYYQFEDTFIEIENKVLKNAFYVDDYKNNNLVYKLKIYFLDTVYIPLKFESLLDPYGMFKIYKTELKYSKPRRIKELSNTKDKIYDQYGKQIHIGDTIVYPCGSNNYYYCRIGVVDSITQNHYIRLRDNSEHVRTLAEKCVVI